MNGKRQTGVKVTYDGSVITWTASDASAEPVTVNVDALTDDIRMRAVMHGIDQKVTDAGAVGVGKWDGEDKPQRSATVAERMARMRAVAERLQAGEWNARRSGDPLAGKTEEQLRALVAAAQAKLEAFTKG